MAHLGSKEELFEEIHQFLGEVAAAGLKPCLVHISVVCLAGCDVGSQAGLLQVTPCILDQHTTLSQGRAGSCLHTHTYTSDQYNSLHLTTAYIVGNVFAKIFTSLALQQKNTESHKSFHCSKNFVYTQPLHIVYT